MMFLKLMSGEDIADTLPYKPFRLIECKEVMFMRGHEDGNGWAQVDGSMIALEGNAYIMNGNGKTIDSYWMPSGESANRQSQGPITPSSEFCCG